MKIYREHQRLQFECIMCVFTPALIITGSNIKDSPPPSLRSWCKDGCTLTLPLNNMSSELSATYGSTVRVTHIATLSAGLSPRWTYTVRMERAVSSGGVCGCSYWFELDLDSTPPPSPPSLSLLSDQLDKTSSPPRVSGRGSGSEV